MALPRQNSINLINKTFSYIFRVQPLSLKGYYNILQGFATWVSDGLGGGGGTFDCHLKDGSIVRSWDGFLFYARPRTSDLYAIYCEEIYELENWFKPHAMGAVVDVGAYIGTYTVRAMHTADLVIAIEIARELNLKLLILGQGPYKNKLEKYAEENYRGMVNFLDHQPREIYLEMLSKARYAINPSKHEAYSIFTAEA